VLSVIAAVGLREPQAAPDGINCTESPETGEPLEAVTVPVTVEVVKASAGTLEGLAVTLIAAGPPLTV
jgi:hypothetical protein